MSRSEDPSCFFEFYSQMNEFRLMNKHTDITIVFDDESFRCHRVVLSAASKYFDTHFSSGLNDSNCDCIVALKDVMEVATFKQILQFIYTGSVTITSQDALKLVQASEFLGLQRVENLCVDFIVQNVKNFPVQNALDIFKFAHATQRTFLASILYPHVVQLFEPFFETTNFLEMPFDAIVKVLKENGTLAREDTIVQAIIRWVNHNREMRCQYAHELSELVQVTNLSIPLLRSLLANFFLSESRNVKYDQEQESEELTDDESQTVECDQEQESKELTDDVCLYVYIRASPSVIPNTKKIFSVSKNCIDCAAIPEGINTDFPWTYSVVLNNGFMYNLYHQEYSSRKMNWELSSCTSINMMSAKSLTSPPFKLNNFRFKIDFCGTERNQVLYLYDKYGPVDPKSDIYSIFSYSCEKDTWSTIKNVKIPLQKSSMTAGFETLYLIGGKNPEDPTSAKCALAYDYRGVWRELPSTHHYYKNAISCVFDSKLYVCGLFGKQCETYDIRAGKWNAMEPVNLGTNKMVQKIIPFSDKLWLFSGDTGLCCYRNNFRVHLYDPVSNKWSEHSALNKLVEETPWHDGCVNDAVVFKSFQFP